MHPYRILAPLPPDADDEYERRLLAEMDQGNTLAGMTVAAFFMVFEVLYVIALWRPAP